MKPDDVSELVVEAVEAECGMGCAAWDCIDPREIIAASFNVLTATLPLPSVSEVAADVEGE